MKLFIAFLLIATTYCADAAAKDCTAGADKMCGQCKKASGCTMCWDGYPKDKICTAPTTKVENCISYKSATECSGCEENYTLASNKCTKNADPTIKNCKAQVGSLCAGCTGFELAADAKSCTETACKLDNCEACGIKSGTAQTCAFCKEGYYKNDKSVCVANPANTDKCVHDAAGKCVYCKPKSFVETFTSDTDFRCSAPSMFFAAILTALNETPLIL